MVSEEVRRRLKQQEADDAAAAMAAAQPLTAAQVARLQHEAAALLEPGESVAAGLRRLGAGLGRRPGKQGAKAAQAAGAGAVPDPDSAAKFERLTALGVSLMEAGETDVYTQSKVGDAWGCAPCELSWGGELASRQENPRRWPVALLKHARCENPRHPRALNFHLVTHARSTLRVQRPYTSMPTRGPPAFLAALRPPPPPTTTPMRTCLGEGPVSLHSGVWEDAAPEGWGSVTRGTTRNGGTGHGTGGFAGTSHNCSPCSPSLHLHPQPRHGGSWR